MKVRYTSPASADLAAVLEGIAQHSPQGAARVFDKIEAAEKLLERFPLSGVQTRLSWLRRMKVESYPYAILYQVTDRDIIIHNVRHTARRPLI